jgi:putative transposase
MARLARVVIPGHPHHVAQRGNGRARTFFGDGDYALCRDLLAEHCRAAVSRSLSMGQCEKKARIPN